MNKIWIQRSYYYFNDIAITAMICDKADPKAKKLLDGGQLFIIYEQLLCYSIQFDGVIKGITPYLLATWLKGGFNTDEVDYALDYFMKMGLIEINDQLHIKFTKFSDYFNLDIGDAPGMTARPGSKSGTKDETIENKVDDKNHVYTNRLIELGYLLNAKQKTIDEFNNYFSSFDYEGAGISDKQVKTALALFMESLKRKFKDNPGTEIRNRLSYFIKSFTDAVSKITKTDEREEYLKALSGAEEDDDYQERLKDLANVSWIAKDDEE